MPFSPCDASCSFSSSARPPPPPPPPPSTSSTAAKTSVAPKEDPSSLAVPAPPLPMKTDRKRQRESSPEEEGKGIVTKKPRTCSLHSSTAPDDKPVNDDDTKVVAATAADAPPKNIDVSLELVLFDKSWIAADSLPVIIQEPDDDDDDQSKAQLSETELNKIISINLAKFRYYSAEDLEEERKYGVSTKLSLSFV